MMIMSDLPNDLLEKILCRVPAASVRQLRSTCKRWNSLINDKIFTRNHLDKSPKQFLIFMLNEFRVCSVSLNYLHGVVPSVEVKGEFSLPDPYYNNLYQFDVCEVFHCDGLLLCIDKYCTRIVVWNPCTGQKRWIQTRHGHKLNEDYALGSYQDSKTGDTSYKILCFWSPTDDKRFEIYEINSYSWRVVDSTPDCYLSFIGDGKFLKGKNYWIACEEPIVEFLLTFDYTTERFGRLPLPSQRHEPDYLVVTLSVLRQEKVSVLLHPINKSSRTEIWVTNEIDETGKVSWSMLAAVDLNPVNVFLHCVSVSFLVGEDKKFLVCTDNGTHGNNMIFIVGLDNQVRQVDLGLASNWPFLFSYVPSLTQIHPESSTGQT